MDVNALVDALKGEVDRLQGRIDQLEDAMGMSFVAPVEWRLTPSEARVFGVLLERDVATKNAIMAALYRNDGRDEAELKIVDVFVCKIRKKLKGFGVEIVTHWGMGWSLANRADVAARLKRGDA